MVVFVQDAWVWFEHPKESWMPVQMVSQNGDDILCKSQTLEHVHIKSAENYDLVHPTSLQEVENMVNLSELTEAAILHDLRLRYEKNKIYTYISEIVVSINPYKMLPYYGPSTIEEYREKLLRREKVAPHVYSLADSAYKNLCMDGQGQAVIISGESGAGKTEATKLVLQYLAELSGQGADIEQQILEANPIIEAFGNAKTVRNDNSSRFGKWIEIMFNEKNYIYGSKIYNYLLEKSRVVSQAEGERNYHIFYMICTGASDAEKKAWSLQAPNKYRLLSAGKCWAVEGVNDQENWNRMRDAMEVLDFSQQEQEQIFRAVAAIMTLGNIQFDQKGDKSQISNPEVLEIAAGLLCVDMVSLGKALVARILKVMKDYVTTFLTKDQARDGRDAFCKALYDRIFSWLIEKINKTLYREAETFNIIGVLDIFGFEIFEENYYEQFCINFANEKLQQHFTLHVFAMEQKEYSLQGLNVDNVAYVDNQGCLDLIEKKHTGILSMISEETRLPKGSDRNLLDRMHKEHKDTEYYISPKTQIPSFTVKHYAGNVTYLITGFMEKDKDTLNGDLAKVCITSSDTFLNTLFGEDDLAGLDNPVKKEAPTTARGKAKAAPKATPKSTPKKPAVPQSPSSPRARSNSATLRTGAQTLGTQFKNSLTSLMTTINSCGPHFIRCIKPNSLKIPDQFDAQLIVKQMRCQGLKEVVKIRQHGYPIRREHDSFLKRYRMIVPGFKYDEGKVAPDDVKRFMSEIKEIQFDSSDWAIGKTKFFSKLRVQTELEKLREERVASVVIRVQSIYRAKAAYERFKLKKGAKDRLDRALETKDENDTEELTKAIEAAEQLQVSMVMIAEGRRKLNYLVDVRQAKAALVAAHSSPSRDVEMLDTAINRALELGLAAETCPQLQAASDLLKALRDYFAQMKEASEQKDIKLLTTALESAQKLGLDTERESTAKVLLVRLQWEDSMIEKLSNAIKARELESISTLIDEIGEQGVLEGYHLTKTHVDEAKVLKARLELEIQIREELAVAITAKDVGLIEAAMKSCEDAKMTDEPSFQEAGALKEQLIREAVVAEASAVLKSAIDSKNYKVLEVAVRAAKEKDLAQDPLTLQAEAVMANILKNQEVLAKLLAAIESRILDSLNVEIKEAHDAKLAEWGMNYQLAVTRATKLQKQITAAQQSLQEAIVSDDLKFVEKALDDAAKIGSPPLAELLEQAKKRKTWLYEKNQRREVLKTALESNNEGLLHNAIDRATKDGHFKLTDEEIKPAKEKMEILKQERILREQELAAAKAAAEEEERLKIEEEKNRKADEERRRREADEAAKRAEEEEKRRIEEEKRRKEEEEQRLKREAEEKVKLEEERKRREAEEKKRREEEDRLAQEELERQMRESESLAEAEREKAKAELEKKQKEQKEKLEHERRIREEEERKKREQEEAVERQRREVERIKLEEARREREEAEARSRAVEEKETVDEGLSSLSYEDEKKKEGGNESDDEEQEVKESHEIKEHEGVREVPKFDPQLYRPDTYAIHLFNKLRTPDQFTRGIIFNKKKLATGMLKFAKEVIPRSLTRVGRLERMEKSKKKLLDRTAVQLFKSLQGVMGDRHYSFPDALALEILETGLKEPLLRDEIYLQIVKQTDENPRPESAVRGWQMMGLCAETFPPSDGMIYHLYHYILKNLDAVDHPAKDYIGYCLRTLQQARPPLTTPPNIEHVIAFKERLMKSDHVIITFPDGSELELDIDPAMDLQTLLPQVKLKIKLREPGFGIFQVGPRSEFRIHENECLLDFEAAKSKDRSVRFLLKKHMYYKRGRTKDPVALSIMYHQALIDVCTGMFEVSREDKLLILAVHKSLVESKYFQPVGRENGKAMDAVRNIAALTAMALPEPEKKEFLASIDGIQATLQNPTPETALAVVRKYPVWGSQFYNVQQDDSSLPNLVLGINLVGVFLLDAATRRTLKKFAYGHLNGWANNSVKFCLRVLVSKGQTMQFNLLTKQGKRIHQTMQENINYLVKAMERRKKKQQQSS